MTTENTSYDPNICPQCGAPDQDCPCFIKPDGSLDIDAIAKAHYDAKQKAASTPPMCPICGNYPVRDGYRVCASCVEAREYAPHYWEGDEPDKLPASTPDAAPTNEQLADALKASQEGAMYFKAERDAARAEVERLREALLRVDTMCEYTHGLFQPESLLDRSINAIHSAITDIEEVAEAALAAAVQEGER